MKYSIPLILSFAITLTTLVSINSQKEITFSQNIQAPKGQTISMKCMDYEEGGLSTPESGLFATCGKQKQHPLASITKVILVLTLLKQVPNLDFDKTITMDNNDRDYYSYEIYRGGSLQPVSVGQIYTLRSVIGALLVVSANNLAFSLVHHYLGDTKNYVKLANKTLKDLSITGIKVGEDPSGYNSTYSTSEAINKVGMELLKYNEIIKITSSKTFPFVDLRFPTKVLTLKNTNHLLDYGYFGLKTGSTLKAGRGVLFAKNSTKCNCPIVGVLLGSTFYKDYSKEIPKIVDESDTLQKINLITQGQHLGTMTITSPILKKVKEIHSIETFGYLLTSKQTVEYKLTNNFLEIYVDKKLVKATRYEQTN